MFGMIKPSLNLVSETQKKLFLRGYCNLCAALSASGTGVWNRFFLITDVVTIDWLLNEKDDLSVFPLTCVNCLKGGVIGKTDQVSIHQRFLAAVSSYICGVKIKDNALDDPKLANKSLALLYKPVMKKAQNSLKEFNILDNLQSYLAKDNENEEAKVSEIHEACEPTAQCYEIVSIEMAKRISSLPLELVRLLGRYLGSYTYLCDAIQDMDEDRKKNQYNVLNCLSDKNSWDKKNEAIKQTLDFLKPMRLQITEKFMGSVETSKVHALKTQSLSHSFCLGDQVPALFY